MLGAWSRVEGYPCDPNPNDPVARVTSESLFNDEGRLNPSITILGNAACLLCGHIFFVCVCVHSKRQK